MSTARPAAARSRARLPDAGGQGRGAVEFLLKLAGAKILAEVLELLDVDGERAGDVIGVGGENVAPDFVGAEREARHVFEARTGSLLARRGAELIGDGGRERGGGELRKMAGEGDDAIVLVGIEGQDAWPDLIGPAGIGRASCRERG